MASFCYLSSDERRCLAGWRFDGISVREAARRLRRSPSTISRELRRNSSEQGIYHAASAEMRFRLRRQRSCILERDKRLAVYVVDRLTEGWSPQQISGRLRSGLGTGTIYRWIRRHDGDLAHMRRFLPRSYDGARSRRRLSRDRISDRAHLSARSDEGNAREEAGHW
ncbi:transposase [Neomegalonema perideroedes]|uniref:transposase n=1 Tax=Neomegalonema perideroedes TaxID=217219 RepID=UPI003898E796